MRITIFGATGNIGRVVVNEALSRGHHVTAITRDAKKAAHLPSGANVEVGDVNHIADVIRFSRGQDLVISATRPAQGQEKQLSAIAHALLEGLLETHTRLLLVGGAACLTVPNTKGKLVLDDERFVPLAWKAIAQACYEQYQHCVSHRNQNWTYMSPAALIGSGERTGQFRISDAELLIDEAGKSQISWQDFAIALLNEAESPQFLGGKFTVGY
ncbi:NAD(P)-dependent oxidoreductase [Pseudoalteromonas luteoviolacea]|uniref:NAD(P)-dependent oxidoreductase n=1 Tax=Pseudoalteromonas luteoviolacea TaxID=43657 RepID=UPI00114EBC75|nr:NAD(P)H-binding protein [Pseudoalteromonas luteoviolacea]TQF66662.1 NAD-dependent epimerase/dehydratase family protein [Pseudoalteromonas luteoviolacea]